MCLIGDIDKFHLELLDHLHCLVVLVEGIFTHGLMIRHLGNVIAQQTHSLLEEHPNHGHSCVCSHYIL